MFRGYWFHSPTGARSTRPGLPPLFRIAPADRPPADSEAVRAALAGIAAELAASDRQERTKRWSRVALGAGALVAIVLGLTIVTIFTVPERRDAYRGSTPVVATTGAVSDVGVAPTRDTISRPAPAPATPATPAIPVTTSRATIPATTAGKKAAARPPAERKSSPSSKRPTPARPTISAIVVVPTKVRVGVARSVTLTATPIDDGGAAVTTRVSWASSATRIATVSSKGVVRGRAPGTATITARSGGKKESVVVTVTRRSPGKQSP